MPAELGPAVGAAQGLSQLGKGLGWGQVPLLTFNLQGMTQAGLDLKPKGFKDHSSSPDTPQQHLP